MTTTDPLIAAVAAMLEHELAPQRALLTSLVNALTAQQAQIAVLQAQINVLQARLDARPAPAEERAQRHLIA